MTSSLKSRLVRALLQAGALIVLVVAWELLPQRLGLTSLVLPEFSDIVGAAGEPLPGASALLPNVVVTVREILVAFALAAIVGVGTGVALGSSKRAEALFRPILTGMFAVPLITLIPLFLVAFGLGEPSKIAFGALYAFFPIVFNTTSGVVSLDQIHLRVGQAFGLSWHSRLVKIVLPGAARQILGGLQMGMAIAIIAVVSAEVFGSTAGLGYLIQRSAQALDGPQVWYVVLVTLALGYALLLLVRTTARLLGVRPDGSAW